jgi:DNA-directed RNA polymerase subunit RPC12/RpoP
MADTRTFHGDLTGKDLANALVARFTDNNMLAQAFRNDSQYVVQIASRANRQSGGNTALGITISDSKDGVTVRLGKQAWFGIAASLGATLISAKMNPLNLLGRLDDIAQDIENLSLDDKAWSVIEDVALAMGASYDLSEKLKSTACQYCGTGNEVGAGRCVACGAPMGNLQPVSCPECGTVSGKDDLHCTNCGHTLRQAEK